MFTRASRARAKQEKPTGVETGTVRAGGFRRRGSEDCEVEVYVNARQAMADLQRKALDRLDLERLRKRGRDSARDEVLAVARAVVYDEVVPLSFAERGWIVQRVLNDVFPPDGEAAGSAVRNPIHPSLNSGSAAASLEYDLDFTARQPLSHAGQPAPKAQKDRPPTGGSAG
jgi:hypothetical protein